MMFSHTVPPQMLVFLSTLTLAYAVSFNNGDMRLIIANNRQPRATQRQGSQASRVIPADYMYYASRLGDDLQTAEGRQGAAPSVGDLAAASENTSAHLSPDAFGSITPKRPAVPASVAPIANHTNVQKQSPQPEPALPPLPPSQLLQILSNLFVAGLEKPGELKPLDVSEPAAGPVKVRGLQGLSAPAVPQTPSTADKERRAHCTPVVDVIFALDDIETIWMARDAIRHYVTHLKPAGKARFGVVLCGPQLSFYTALHTHFSGLLASLEDLQHANTTLDSNRVQMPDTLGYRGDNNPYPPSVSSDFSQIEARCFETAYYMFMSQQTKDIVDRILTVVGTKERWAHQLYVDEAHYLHSLNISTLVVADGSLPQATLASLRNMASSNFKFRAVTDSVTVYSLPSLIAQAICLPKSADITVPIQRVLTTVAPARVFASCRLLNSTALERMTNFGQDFGFFSDRIVCMPGTIANLRLCACV